MADVAQKVITANEIYNNKSVVMVNPTTGARDTKTRDTNNTMTTAEMETKWTDRFDDPTYFT